MSKHFVPKLSIHPLLVKETAKKYDIHQAKIYPTSIGIPDIGECWPRCRNTEAHCRTHMEAVCGVYATCRLL